MSTLTKIFIVLQLVFSLALSVLVIMVVSSQPKYKDQVDGWQKTAIAAQAANAMNSDMIARLQANNGQLSIQIAEAAAARKADRQEAASRIAALEQDKANLQGQLAEASANITKGTESNKSLQTQYTTVTEQLVKARETSLAQLRRAEEVNRENERLTQEVAQLTRALRRAQEEVVALSEQNESLRKAPAGGTGAAPGAAGSITSATVAPVGTPPVNGSIARVDNRDGKTFFSMPLGRRDGLQNGMTVIISRNNSYVGDAVIVNAQVEESVAAVKVLNKGQTVQAGDIVTVAR